LKWEFKMTALTSSGVLSTASGLVFTGSREGYVFGLDARTGAMLWRANVGGASSASPMTYQVDGKQYVALASGNSLFIFALRN
jgi:alcohol dehydrogenase (cytochrome c)